MEKLPDWWKAYSDWQPSGTFCDLCEGPISWRPYWNGLPWKGGQYLGLILQCTSCGEKLFV